ncbi:MAG TPA: creatininase family protein [Rhizomicrobium sp.]|nr:creatininase family protein [Rhizomicrobium sp.]
MRYTDLTTEEAGKELRERILLVPVGSIEQHGPHLPLSVDCDIPAALCVAAGRHMPVLVGPTLPIGARSLPQSGGGVAGLPGTLFVRGEVLIAYLHDVLLSFVRAGARRVVLLNGHYENEAHIFEAVAQLEERGALEGVCVLVVSWWSLIDEDLVRRIHEAGYVGWHAEHASFVETALMLHIRPSLVRDIRIDNDEPPAAGVMVVSGQASGPAHRGVLNKTSGATAEHGRNFFDAIVAGLLACMRRSFGPVLAQECAE